MKKVILWGLLGIFSTALAEVSISSQPLVFFNTYGLLFVLPLYTFHILFLAPLAMKKEQPVRFSSLIFAGCLFGLYEAYITKVLWNPPWNDNTVTILQISVFTFLVIVFFYHTWMSFIFPLLLVEYFVFADRRIFNSLPEKLQVLFKKRSFQIMMFIFFGFANGVGENSFFEAILSVIGSSLIMLLALWLTRKVFSGNQASLVDYLPRGKSLIVIGILLLAVYGIHLFGSRPEAFPGLIGHVMIWLAYVGFGILLYRSQKASLPEEEKEPLELPKINGKWFALTGIYLCSVLLAVAYLKTFQPYIVMILWGVGIPFGLVLFVKSVMQLSTKKVVLSTEIPQKL